MKQLICRNVDKMLFHKITLLIGWFSNNKLDEDLCINLSHAIKLNASVKSWNVLLLLYIEFQTAILWYKKTHKKRIYKHRLFISETYYVRKRQIHMIHRICLEYVESHIHSHNRKIINIFIMQNFY